MLVKYTEMPNFRGRQCHLRCRSLVALYWAVFVSSVEELPDWLLHSSHGCNETLPLEAACATGTAAHAAAPLLSWEAWILCQALRTLWGWGMGAIAVKMKVLQRESQNATSEL